MKRLALNADQASLTQRQYSKLVEFDSVTTNNLIARNILPVDEVLRGRGRGVRLFTPLNAWMGRIMSESVKHHKMPLADAAEIAGVARRLAKKEGWIGHWARALSEGRPYIAAFLAVTWTDDCYDAQIIEGDEAGGPNFSSPKMARFLTHPFMVVPLSALFKDVWEKSIAMLSAVPKD
jgi:hypothetical protein